MTQPTRVNKQAVKLIQADSELRAANTRIAELEAQVRELQWKEISPESLPKAGDEICGYDPAEGIPRIQIRVVSKGLADIRNRNPYHRDWERLGYTHYRLFTPPRSEREGEKLC